MPASRIQGVIFDIDGTLVDSNDAHARAWVEAFAEEGHQVAYDRVRRLIGMGGDKLIPEVLGISKDSPQGEELSTRRATIFRERYLPTLRAFDAAGELLRRLRARGLVLVVATSAKEEEMQPLLALTGAADAFAERTSSDDVERSKPDPDVVQEALTKIGRAAAETVMIGDTPYDLEAASRAGVPFIGFRCGGWQDADLADAVAIYDGPWDLVEKLEQSPIAARERAPA